MQVLGIDEVGRGAWAGPMVLGGVIVGQEFDELVPLVQGTKKFWEIDGLKIADSKMLSIKEREQAYDWIVSRFVWRVVEVTPAQIKDLGLSVAWKQAVVSLVRTWDKVPVFVDGNWKVTYEERSITPVVKGDSKLFSIACAAIVAKVYRDRLMQELALRFGDYGWERNVGYGTKVHQDGILTAGMCEHHRKDWVEKWLEKQAK